MLLLDQVEDGFLDRALVGRLAGLAGLPELVQGSGDGQAGAVAVEQPEALRQRQVDALMRAKGYTATDWQTRVFPGAIHDEASWAARLDQPLAFLFAWP